MIQNATIQNSALCMAVAKNFPDGKWELVQNQDEESPLTDEPILLTDEEQAKMDELHAMLDEGDEDDMELPPDICLFDAVINGSLADVQYLVETQGADVNVKCGYGYTPLHFAAECNPDPNVLKYLISQGADVNVKDCSGETPLDIAYTEPKKRILREAMGLVPWG